MGVVRLVLFVYFKVLFSSSSSAFVYFVLVFCVSKLVRVCFI